ncbi:MAG TPA: fibronectin type III domain-containing protein [Alkalispirochaeta sp.]|nr:fibronectin type III domain-containing protein [Alkalispirochaeta sp.]
MRISAIYHRHIILFSFCAAFAVLSAALPLAAQTTAETVELGGRNGWSLLAERENTMVRDGWQGGQDLTLADWGAQVDSATDLLVPFDRSAQDVTGRYQSSGDGVEIRSVQARFGAGAAAFNGNASVTYRAGGDALLVPDTQPAAFTFDLWLYPLRITEGATVLRWRGALINAGTPVLQELRLTIRDNHLVWKLGNLVMDAGAGGTRQFSTEYLEGRRGLVPGRWSHHQLRYDRGTAQLSYRVNGVPETITYLTDDGTEGSAPASIFFGADTGDGLVIGQGLHGFVDELRITRDAQREPRPVSYSGDPGRAYTVPIALGDSGGRVESVDLRVQEPGGTEVRGWYRTADLVVSRDAGNALPTEWRRIPQDGRLPMDAQGTYLQMRFDLLADAAGERAPRLQHVAVRYRPYQPPPVPRGLSGEGVPAGVTLSWSPVRTPLVAGYRVYVGERPGRYFGTTGVSSPIDVGDQTEFTVEGLQPDRAYVFTVESYDQHGESSGLAREIHVRAVRGQP